jgi:hypothetical protein
MRPQSLSRRAFGGGALRVSEFIEGIRQESVGFEIVGISSPKVGWLTARVAPEGRFIRWHAAGFYDESDDFQSGYSVAGFIGNQHDCVHFDFAWKEKILDKYGLKYFKASELNAGGREFAKFRDDPSDLNKKFSKREKEIFGQIKTDSIYVIWNSI